ncbi:FMRFamide receptor [Elysia marginata]|uniref:FMRFamide receptor n=1 Tax=Elysia marginata TaxID=1093978 RepID=A0AAV4J1R7_9GAST|nr:FMRFamide receptor [Elysia marginata]
MASQGANGTGVGEATAFILRLATTSSSRVFEPGHLVAAAASISATTTTSLPSPPPASSSQVLRERVEFLNLIMLGGLGCGLAVLGLLGNCLSMLVLQRPKMRSSTSYFLLSLAVYDNLILLGMLAYFCVPALVPYSPGLRNVHSAMHLTIVAGYPLSLAAQMGSIYTCVGFTVERYIAVCKPLHVANTCTKSRTIRVIILVFFWSILYNIPRFFHYEIYYTSNGIPGEELGTPSPNHINVTQLGNRTDCLNCCTDVILQNASNYLCAQQRLRAKGINDPSYAQSTPSTTFASIIMNSLLKSTMSPPVLDTTDTISTTSPVSSSITTLLPSPRTTSISLRESEFGRSATFKHIYLIYSQLFFMFLIPFLAILLMNVGLIRAVKVSMSAQRSMCASARKEHNLTVMLIAVIVVFLVCQFPTIVDNILVAVVGERQLKTSYTYWCFYTTCTLMVLINAASNFLLYCFFGKKFRLVLLAILGCKPRQRQVAYRSTVTKSRTNGLNRTYEMEVSML